MERRRGFQKAWLNKMAFYIKAKVTASAKKDSLIKKDESTFIISVSAKREKNHANVRVRELISDYFKIPKSYVKIVRGHKNPNKLLEIREI